MKTTSNTKKTFAAFEAQAIKADQQLAIKGGETAQQTFIGTDEVAHL